MKVKICLILVLCVLVLCGCEEKMSSASITRDEAKTGGSLSFVYDMHDRTIYIGGEGEFVQYTAENISKGIESGNVIGLKIEAPNEVENVSETVVEMNGKVYKDLAVEINGNEQRFFYFYPDLQSEDLTFSIDWNERLKGQNYKLVLVKGTKFLDENGEVVDE